MTDMEEAIRIIEAHDNSMDEPLDELTVIRVAAEIARIRKEAASEAMRDDFRMDELDAVMLSVDKWLTGDALKNNPATRAADAREYALRAIERAADEARKAERDRCEDLVCAYWGGDLEELRRRILSDDKGVSHG